VASAWLPAPFVPTIRQPYLARSLVNFLLVFVPSVSWHSGTSLTGCRRKNPSTVSRRDPGALEPYGVGIIPLLRDVTASNPSVWRLSPRLLHLHTLFSFVIVSSLSTPQSFLVRPLHSPGGWVQGKENAISRRSTPPKKGEVSAEFQPGNLGHQQSHRRRPVRFPLLKSLPLISAQRIGIF
jgi:hypothetical protein